MYVRTKNIIFFALSIDKFYIVYVCSSAKETWDVLEFTFEGIEKVKIAMKNTLIQEYEMLMKLQK